ncbi:MAG: rane protein [Naasia sp.]|uniref:fluoride efflux transporter FluC n=1 Tax=Naasia sp. TaxID=2546198 RepID=UPI0034192B54|nr:rane protein [Naasia sp.]
MTLPEDPDTPPLADAEQAPHRRLRLIGLVAAGGAAGTAARHLLTQAFPAAAEPLAILGINTVGAFALGLLLEQLVRSGPDTGRRLAARVTVGTGVLGGFTTYSTLALDTVQLSAGSFAGVGYAIGTLALGVAAAFAGVLLASPRRA